MRLRINDGFMHQVNLNKKCPINIFVLFPNVIFYFCLDSILLRYFWEILVFQFLKILLIRAHYCGGSRGHASGAHPPPRRDPILFSHMFLPKSAHVGGRRPPNGKFWICHCINYINQLYCIGGSRGRCAGRTPPLWDPILSFSHTFLSKSAHVGGPHPPNGSTPPLREILDPPLYWYVVRWS